MAVRHVEILLNSVASPIAPSPGDIGLSSHQHEQMLDLPVQNKNAFRSSSRLRKSPAALLQATKSLTS
jgi:hypothetical protein